MKDEVTLVVGGSGVNGGGCKVWVWAWVMVVVVVSPYSLPLLFPSHCPLLPPHEQMLAAAVEGAVVVAVMAVFPSPFSWLVVTPFHPPCWCRCPLAPPTHPASSCSLWWEGGASCPCCHCCWHHCSGIPPHPHGLPLSALLMAVSTHDPPGC